MLDAIGLLATVGSGGLFGVLGSVLGMVSKYFVKKQELEERALDRIHELKLIELQQQAAAQETEQEIKLADSSGSWQGLDASIRADTALVGHTHMWVNDVKALFRPVLTATLWGLAAWELSMLLDGTIIEALQSKEAWVKDLIIYSVHTTFFMTGTATGWWFGDRALSPPGQK